MQTKFPLVKSKAIEGSRWHHLVSVKFPPREDENEQDFRGYYPTGTGLEHHMHRTKREFTQLLDKQYGDREGRYSIRWSDNGADIRFQNEEDAASFLLFYTCDNKPEPWNMKIQWHRTSIIFKDGTVLKPIANTHTS